MSESEALEFWRLIERDDVRDLPAADLSILPPLDEAGERAHDCSRQVRLVARRADFHVQDRYAEGQKAVDQPSEDEIKLRLSATLRAERSARGFSQVHVARAIGTPVRKAT